MMLDIGCESFELAFFNLIFTFTSLNEDIDLTLMKLGIGLIGNETSI